MVAPVIVSYSGSAGCPTTTGITIPAPSGIQENEILYGTIFGKFGFGSSLILPSGWDVVYNVSASSQSFSTCYRITDASDVTATGYDFGFASNRESFRGYIYRISGGDIDTPFLASGALGNQYGNQTSNSRLNLSMGDTLLIATHNHRGGTWGTDVINYNGWTLITNHDCGSNQHEQETFYNVFENAGRSNTPEIDLLREYTWGSTVVAIKPAIEPPSWGIQNSVVVSKNVVLKG
jgi:hypothetical protein